MFSAYGENRTLFKSVNIILRAKIKDNELNASTINLTPPESPVDYLSGLCQNLWCNGDSSFAALGFFLHSCSSAIGTPDGHPRAVKLILPRAQGYLSKSDILEQRLLGCEGVDKVQSFCRPRQFLMPQSAVQEEWASILQILSNAVGGILLDDSEPANLVSRLCRLEAELDKRLSFQWIMPQPIIRKQLAFVDGRDRTTTERLLRTAKSLGIGMVVLDKPNHWLELPEAVNLRDRFVPLKIGTDEGLSMRIVEALKDIDIHLDGMATNFEHYASQVAKAATFLGLPSEPFGAFDLCRDKYRQQVTSGNVALRIVKGQKIDSAVNGEVEFPVVVKPTRGAGSEGVTKVYGLKELEEATNRIFESNYEHVRDLNAASVEPYCSGPEVDANFVLQDGKVIFVEIADDFPKAGDTEGKTSSNVFKETGMLFPSGLEAAELDMIKTSLHQTLLKFGFRSGVFHVEARVRNSSMQYGISNGILDLERVVDRHGVESPSCSLLEVNPRVPGTVGVEAVQSTYGVDYAALHLLFAVRDKERISALSQPFRDGPQFWSNIVFIIPDRGGVLASDDIGDDIKKRSPDLWRSISSYCCCFEKGQRVPDPAPDDVIWLAWFVVYSRAGRRDVLEISQRLKMEVRYDLV